MLSKSVFSVQSTFKSQPLTRALQGYFYNTTDSGGGYFAPPLRTQEVLVGFTQFKRRSIDLENLSRET